MFILNIYGARAVFLLFCVHQATESKKLEMKTEYLDQYSPFKILPRTLWERYVHTLKNSIQLWHFLILLELDPFFYYFVITRTLNLSNKK